MNSYWNPVDCEQSLLLPPVIVYRAQKHRLCGEWDEMEDGYLPSLVLPLVPFSACTVLPRSVHDHRREKWDCAQSRNPEVFSLTNEHEVKRGS